MDLKSRLSELAFDAELENYRERASRQIAKLNIIYLELTKYWNPDQAYQLLLQLPWDSEIDLFQDVFGKDIKNE